MAEEGEKQSRYYKIRDACSDVVLADGAKEKTVATLKLLGKGVFNVGMFTATEIIPKIPAFIAEQALKNPNATPEQKQKASEYLGRDKRD